MPNAALSPSRAGDFMQCPLLYRFRVVDRLVEVPTPAMVRGTLVHSVLERLFDLPAGRRTVEAATAMLIPSWQRICDDTPSLAESIPAEAEGQAAWLAEAERLVSRWFTLEDPNRLQPAERELFVQTALDDGLVLRGYVDRLDIAPDGRMRVVDYKTGRAPREAYEGRALFQMKFYSLVLWRLRNAVPDLLQLVYLGSGEMIRYEPDEGQLAATERKLRALWAAIERAAVANDWRASPGRLCDWCSHRAVCPAWGGHPPPVPADALERVRGDPIAPDLAKPRPPQRPEAARDARSTGGGSASQDIGG